MRMVALLRGINVGGNRIVPMARLCALAEKAGLTEVRSYIQSGNLVFNAGRAEVNKVAHSLERLIEKEFGFEAPVITRTAAQWAEYVDANPFPSVARARPNFLMLGLCKEPCARDAAAALQGRAMHGEQVKRIGDALWIDFAAGVGKSKLTPAVFDKAAGSTVTLRNWNTVLKIAELLA